MSSSWHTCAGIDVSNCGTADAIQLYMKCYVSQWRKCENENECKASGYCSDREWTTVVRSSTYPINVQVSAQFEFSFSFDDDIILDRWERA